ncbi:MAG: hypothetical protein LR017_01640 [Candidatus Pacebacteria bacterium]|jgi:myo-inositol-1(or 4)-monophosphatase|nr:hypothetical protein [Candidatus Paceibacterota bacterium]
MKTCNFCIDLIIRAGEMLQEKRKEAFSVSFKDDNPKDVVTSLDIEMNDFITAEIQKYYPEHTIYSEEASEVAGNECQWAIDPIDGSAAFARGIPQYAISIGLLEGGAPVLGVVYDPATRELFSYEKGKGVFLNGEPVVASIESDLKSSFVLFAAGRKDEQREWAGESFKRLLGSVHKTKNFSSSALALCYVASGRIEGVVAGTFTTRDIAAAIGMVYEQGGVVLTEDGNTAALRKSPQRVFIGNTRKTAEDLISLLMVE